MKYAVKYRMMILPLRRVIRPDCPPHDLSPSDAFLQPLLLLLIEPPHLDQCGHKLREPLISQRSSKHRLRLRNSIPLPKRHSIPIRECHKSEGRRDEARLSRAHEIFAGNVDLLILSDVGGGVGEGEETTAG